MARQSQIPFLSTGVMLGSLGSNFSLEFYQSRYKTREYAMLCTSKGGSIVNVEFFVAI